MPDNDEGSPRPRHRKNGRARKRSSSPFGRHLCVVPEAPEDQKPAEDALRLPVGAYPVEDLASMSPSAADLLLDRARAEAGLAAEPIPHLVITRDTESGMITHSGPFDTGLEALTMAHNFVDKYRDLEPRWSYTLTVAPLLPD